jgi:hypothetical protein
VEQQGLGVDRTALQAVQCAAAVRYDSQSVSMVDAVVAHHHSLALCRQIARAILGKPERVQWRLGRTSA